MTRHQAKTAALIAYQEQMLSAEGVRRIETHLSLCVICQQELAEIQAFALIAEEVQNLPLPHVDYEAIGRRLAEEGPPPASAPELTSSELTSSELTSSELTSSELTAPEQNVLDFPERSRVPGPPRRSLGGVYVALSLAAAALLAWVVWPQPQQATHVPEPTEGISRELPEESLAHNDRGSSTFAPESLSRPARVTLVGGRPTWRPEGREGVASIQPMPVDFDAELAEGTRVSTGPDGAVHLRFRSGVGLIALADTQLQLSRLRDEEIRLELSEGEISQAVDPLMDGARYIVLAGGYEVRVQGTHFAVSYRNLELTVDVHRGRVSIRKPNGEDISVEAPGYFTSLEGRDSSPAMVPPMPRDLLQVEGLTLTRLEDPSVIRWRVGDLNIEAEGRLEVGLLPGHYRVETWELGGRHRLASIEVNDVPLELDAVGLRERAPVRRAGHLDPDQIQPVIARGRRHLQRCYEASLRRQPELRQDLRLRLAVDSTGGVARARVLGATGAQTDDLRQCIIRRAMQWTFPPPDGPLSFELPLHFSAR